MARLSIDRVTKTLRRVSRARRCLARRQRRRVPGRSSAPPAAARRRLLRLIAGFDKLDGGRIGIGDTVVSTVAQHVPPERRRIGIVFQSYALWPHMTVAENVAYGLTVAGVRDPERARRVDGGARPGRARRLRRAPAGRCCRAASASAWRSRAASSPSPRWCCSTSRSPISTSICAPRWRTNSRASTRAPARPWSTSPTTRPKRWRWPTASR